MIIRSGSMEHIIVLWKQRQGRHMAGNFTIIDQPDVIHMYINHILSVSHYDVKQMHTRELLDVIAWGKYRSAVFAPTYTIRPYSIKTWLWKEYSWLQYHEYKLMYICLYEAEHLASFWIQTAASTLTCAPIISMLIGKKPMLTRFNDLINHDKLAWL